MKKKKLLLILFLIASLLGTLIIAAQVSWRSIGKLTWVDFTCRPFSSISYECVFYDGELVHLQAYQGYNAPMEISINTSGYLLIMTWRQKEEDISSIQSHFKSRLSNSKLDLIDESDNSPIISYYYDVRKKDFVHKDDYGIERRENGYPSNESHYTNLSTLTASGWMEDVFEVQNENFAYAVKSLPAATD